MAGGVSLRPARFGERTRVQQEHKESRPCQEQKERKKRKKERKTNRQTDRQTEEEEEEEEEEDGGFPTQAGVPAWRPTQLMILFGIVSQGNPATWWLSFLFLLEPN